MARRKLVSEQESLWAAIMANPADDAPRLIYADWLDENGGEPERAQLIRVQCRLARMAYDDPERQALVKQETKLLKGRQQRWTAELPKFKNVVWGELSRGFVDSVYLKRVYEFRKFSARIAEVIPLHAVHVRPSHDYARMMAGFGKMKALARVSELSLPFQQMTATVLDQLLASPLLTNITKLELSGNPLRYSGIKSLLETKSLPSLKILLLCECGLTREAALLIAESPWVQQLSFLDVKHNSLPTAAEKRLRDVFGDRVKLHATAQENR